MHILVHVCDSEQAFGPSGVIQQSPIWPSSAGPMILEHNLNLQDSLARTPSKPSNPDSFQRLSSKPLYGAYVRVRKFTTLSKCCCVCLCVRKDSRLTRPHADGGPLIPVRNMKDMPPRMSLIAFNQYHSMKNVNGIPPSPTWLNVAQIGAQGHTPQPHLAAPVQHPPQPLLITRVASGDTFVYAPTMHDVAGPRPLVSGTSIERTSNGNGIRETQQRQQQNFGREHHGSNHTHAKTRTQTRTYR